MRRRILEIIWDEDVIQKLWRKHRVVPREVEQVVFEDDGASFRWHRSRRHGRRLLVRGRTAGGRRLLVILRPVDPERGVWRCASAWDDD
jgi:uncharacterized DUF497 family protein